MKQSRTDPKEIYAVVKRDLIRVHFDEIKLIDKSNSVILLRSDICTKKIYDYQQIDERYIAVLTDYQIAILD